MLLHAADSSAHGFNALWFEDKEAVRARVAEIAAEKDGASVD